MELTELHHLSKSYGRVAAVQDLSLTLNPGRVTGLIGANGSGQDGLHRHLVPGVFQAGAVGQGPSREGGTGWIVEQAPGGRQNFMLEPRFRFQPCGGESFRFQPSGGEQDQGKPQSKVASL